MLAPAASGTSGTSRSLFRTARQCVGRNPISERAAPAASRRSTARFAPYAAAQCSGAAPFRSRACGSTPPASAASTGNAHRRTAAIAGPNRKGGQERERTGEDCGFHDFTATDSRPDWPIRVATRRSSHRPLRRQRERLVGPAGFVRTTIRIHSWFSLAACVMPQRPMPTSCAACRRGQAPKTRPRGFAPWTPGSKEVRIQGASVRATRKPPL